MKLSILSITFSLLLSAAAKPGEPYTLTGRESSVFGIFQADLKAYPELYADEDVNVYYEAFKSLNNLGERKLQLGEELMFPDTAISKKIREAKEAEAAREAAREAAQAEAAAARERAKEAPAPATTTPKTDYSGQVSLFGSDRPSSRTSGYLQADRERAETARKNARHEAIRHFQQTLLPNWMFDFTLNIVQNIENGDIETLTEQAQEKVDEPFSKALVLHTYPEQQAYVLQFEQPEKVGEYFFFAIKKEESGRLRFYSLERGITFFGTGDLSVLHEWQSARDYSDLGGRSYSDLPSFLKELKNGPSEASEAEDSGQ